jgi:hypothetical protein
LRLTLDLDRCSKRRAEGVWRLLRHLFPENRIQERISPGGKGRHFIVWGASGDWREIQQLRRWLGDDIRRIAVDEFVRHHADVQTQVLFTEKRGRFSVIVREVNPDRTAEVGQLRGGNG